MSVSILDPNKHLFLRCILTYNSYTTGNYNSFIRIYTLFYSCHVFYLSHFPFRFAQNEALQFRCSFLVKSLFCLLIFLNLLFGFLDLPMQSKSYHFLFKNNYSVTIFKYLYILTNKNHRNIVEASSILISHMINSHRSE